MYGSTAVARRLKDISTPCSRAAIYRENILRLIRCHQNHCTDNDFGDSYGAIDSPWEHRKSWVAVVRTPSRRRHLTIVSRLRWVRVSTVLCSDDTARRDPRRRRLKTKSRQLDFGYLMSLWYLARRFESALFWPARRPLLCTQVITLTVTS